MKILETWKQGFKLLRPKEIVLIMYILKKSIPEAYRLVGIHLWYLLIPCLVYTVLIENFPQIYFSYRFNGIISYIFVFFYVVGVAKSVRASVGLKNYAYYGEFSFIDGRWKNIKDVCNILGFALSSSIVFVGSICASMSLCSYFTEKSLCFKGVLTFVGMYMWPIAPLTVLWIFMYWQARPVFGRIGISFFRAGKMMIYNYPLILITYVFMIGGIESIAWIIRAISSLWGGSAFLPLTIGLLSAPALYAIWSVLFIKLWHEHIELYTSGPRQ